MTMTSASSEYFEKVAGDWDAIRAGYFTEAVRRSAIAKAYLRPDMVVADVGAGTGYMTSGLAPLVRRVYVLDGSPAMLEVARRNLAQLNNLVFQKADGQSLPLPDDSLDAVFANMYLHHCPDPLAAIKEMARILRPGGRLVITDMDAHGYEWFKQEMADVWLGFERPQVRTWLEAAGLVNLIVDCSGQSCSTESKAAAIQETVGKVTISIFLATGTKRVSGALQAVQADYAAAAEGKSRCSRSIEASSESVGNTDISSCCNGNAMFDLLQVDEISVFPGYTQDQRSLIPNEAIEISLGCGNPTALAKLKPGEVVLDIGSGGGLDALLAARQVGPEGKVIGVDMTPEMVERARQSAQYAGFSQVEFRLGHAEALPVEDHSVDVVISNCVINLCEDKGRVFAEAFRVLADGGRLEVSDMVSDGSFPGDLREDPQNWAGCIYGALPEQEYVDLVAQAGFQDIQVRRSSSSGEAAGVKVYSIQVSAHKSG